MDKAFAAIIVACALAFGPVSADESSKGSDQKKSGRICAAGPATLKGVKGSVLLSRGGSFKQASDGMRLASGDHIIARDGVAFIVMGGEIVSQVSDGEMLTIREKDGAVCVARVSANPSAVGQAEEAGAIDTEGLFLTGGAIGVTGLGLGVGISSANSGANASNYDLPPNLSP
jgi:hypothetical protein